MLGFAPVVAKMEVFLPGNQFYPVIWKRAQLGPSTFMIPPQHTLPDWVKILDPAAARAAIGPENRGN